MPEAVLPSLTKLESDLARLGSKPDYVDLVGELRQVLREIRADFERGS